MIEANKLKPMPDMVFVSELERGPSLTRGGIILPDDNMKESGIKPRWGKIWAVGSNIKDVTPGEWVLVEHGRWTFGIEVEDENGEPMKVWRIEYPNAVLVVSSEDPRTNSEYKFT